MKSENLSKYYAPVAAVGFAVFAVNFIVNSIGMFTYSLMYGGSPQYIFLAIVTCIAYIGMTVTVFIKNKKAVLAFSVVNALITMGMVKFAGNLYIGYFLSYAILSAIIVLNMKGNDVVKKIWFIPGVARFIFDIFYWIFYSYFSYIEETWTSILLNIIISAAFIFAGLWLKEDFATAEKETVNLGKLNGNSTVNTVFAPVHQANTAMPNIGDADRLMKLKSLLDSGIITKEEFDEKKKQILGL